MTKTLTSEARLALKNLLLSSTRKKTPAPVREFLVLTYLTGSDEQRRAAVVKFLEAIWTFNTPKRVCPFRPGHDRRPHDSVMAWVDPDIDEQVEQYYKVEEHIKELCSKVNLPYLPKVQDLEEYEKCQAKI